MTLAQMTGEADDRISILTASTLFPNVAQPSHGIFVETRLCKLVEDGRVRSHVLAPIPWMPPHISYGSLGASRDVPLRTQQHGIDVAHPRFLVIPKIGMNLAPYTLF